MSTSRKVLKNFLSLSVAEVISRILGALLSLFVARYLGVNPFAQLTFALAFTSYFNIFADFGLTTLGVREIAKDKTITNSLGTSILAAQTSIAILMVLILGAVLSVLQLDPHTKLITFLMGISVLPTALNMAYIFQAHERMEYVGITRVVTQMGYVLIGFILIYFYRDVIAIPLAQLITSLFGVVLIFYLLKNKVQFSLTKIHTQKLKEITIRALPFLISGLAIQIYFNADSIFLQFMKGTTAVGLYGGGYKIINIIIMGLSFMQTVFFPLFSSVTATESNYEKYLKFFSRILLFFFIPISVGGILLAKQIIQFVLGNAYLPATSSFQILMILPFIISFSAIIAVPLLSQGGEKVYTKATVFSAVVNIIFNFLLIPTYSLNGAAVSTVLAELSGLLFLWFTNKKFSAYMFSSAWKPLIASIIMGISLLYLQLFVHSIIPLVIIGIIIYGIISTLIKSIEISEIKQILTLRGK